MGEGGGRPHIDFAQPPALTAIDCPVAIPPLAPLLTHRHEAVDVATAAVEEGIGKADGVIRIQPGEPGRSVKMNGGAGRMLIDDHAVLHNRDALRHLFSFPSPPKVTQQESGPEGLLPRAFTPLLAVAYGAGESDTIRPQTQ